MYQPPTGATSRALQQLCVFKVNTAGCIDLALNEPKSCIHEYNYRIAGHFDGELNLPVWQF